MIKQRHEVNMAKGPPGYVVRKSRDALWKFDVRGDPPLIETGNLTGFNNLSGLNPVMALLIFSEIAGCNRPDGRGMPGRMMNDEGRMMNDRNAEVIIKLGLKPKFMGIQDPLPEGNGKGYCFDRNFCKIEKSYPLLPRKNRDRLSALAFDRALTPKSDGPGSGNAVINQKMVINNCDEVLKPRLTCRQEVQDDKEKDCVRLDNFPEGTKKQFGKLGNHRAPGVIFNAVRSKDADRFKEPRFEKLTCQRAQLLTASREAVILKQMGFKNCVEFLKPRLTCGQEVQDDKKKDCVRLDNIPEGTHNQLGKQGFHRAPGVNRMMNGE